MALAAVAALAVAGSLGVVTGGWDLGPDADEGPRSPVEGGDQPPGIVTEEELAELPPPAEELDRVRTVTTSWGHDHPNALPGVARTYGMDLAADVEVVDDVEEVLVALEDGRAVLGVVPTLAVDGSPAGLVSLEDDLGIGGRARPVLLGDPDLVAAVGPLLDELSAAQVAGWWRRWQDLDDLPTVARAAVASVPEPQRPAAALSDRPAPEEDEPIRLHVGDGEVERLLAEIIAEGIRQVPAPATGGDHLEVEVVAGDPWSLQEVAESRGDLWLTTLEVVAEELYGSEVVGDTSEELRETLADAVAPAAVGSILELPLGASFLVTEDVAGRFEVARLSDLRPAAEPVAPVDPG